jgi:hypothetical protein
MCSLSIKENNIDEQDDMKSKLLDTVSKLKDQGVDFAATPPLFTWTYPEEPEVLFELLITSLSNKNKHLH